MTLQLASYSLGSGDMLIPRSNGYKNTMEPHIGILSLELLLLNEYYVSILLSGSF